ncbi:MAG: hypothetical protein ACYDBW_13130, partial [Sulfuricaulis sp.]
TSVSYSSNDNDINIYDLQYDGKDEAWATWVSNDGLFKGADTAVEQSEYDTVFYFGNEATKTPLFTAVSPYWAFGPPVFPADVITNPYKSGAVTVVQILGRPTSTPPEYWYPPYSQTWYVNYLDNDVGNIDLRKINPQELDQAQEYQFLP